MACLWITSDRPGAECHAAWMDRAEGWSNEVLLREYVGFRAEHIEALRSTLLLGRQDHFRGRRLSKLRRAAFTTVDGEVTPADTLILMACAIDAHADGVPVFAHLTAAAIWGLPTIGKAPELVEYKASAGSHGRAPQARRRRTSVPAAEILIGGLSVTTCERTIVDHARHASLESALAMCDNAIRAGITTRQSLLEELDTVPKGARGKRMAALAIHLADARAESVLESLSRARMFQLSLPCPQLQTEFRDANGFVGRVDFYWPELGAVGEADGMTKYAVPEGGSGEEAVNVLLREKQRELRLRRHRSVNELVRWGWDDAMSPGHLFNVLTGCGIRPVLDGGWPVPPGPLPPTAFLERRRCALSPSGGQTRRAE